MSDEIWVIPFFGQGHILPSVELCKHIASRNFKTSIFVSSDLTSTIPSSLSEYPLIQVAEIPNSSPDPKHHPSDPLQHHFNHHSRMAHSIQILLSTRGDHLPVCAVVDVMMASTIQVFTKFHIPSVGFFTSGACSAAIEHAMWRTSTPSATLNLKPGETLLLPGLPPHMALTDSDLKTRPHDPPPPPPGLGPPPGTGLALPPGIRPPFMGPPKPGGRPPWMEETQDCKALMINTCSPIEQPFLDYLWNQIGKPVWGVGPLLPEKYWKSAGSILHDHEFRANRRSTVSESEVVAWLDSKPHGSVVYISFGTEVGPTMEEYSHIAEALEASDRCFIWVIQPGSGRSGPPHSKARGEGEGYFPHGLEKRVGDRGLIIHGWAPQLLILSHPSTGGFLSHCGWNSVVEAIGRGVPILGWPIRGDQHNNIQLIVKHLNVGCKISDDFSKVVTRDDIVNGIETLLRDEDIKNRAALLASQFQLGFPSASLESFDAFKDFIIKNKE